TARLRSPRQLRDPEGVHDRGRQADARRAVRDRPAAGRPGGGRETRAAPSRPLQAEGHPLRGRDSQEEGRQGRGHRNRRGRGEVTMQIKTKEDIRDRIHRRIRKRVAGTPERPRLAVFRSQSHIYAQLIDDDAGRTLCSASSLDKELKGEGAKRGANVESAKKVGQLIASRAKEKGIEAVVFDRGGFQYHGRIKALADAARESGLKF